MHEVADESRRPGPGGRLRTAREHRGLGVRDAAQRLRLDPSVIEALEADDFARLPAPIFVKGYLNAYGRLLGLPSDELIADYTAATDAAPPPLVVRRGTGEDIDSPTSRRILRIGWLLGALAVVAVAAAWWYQQRRAPDAAAAEGPAATAATAVPVRVPPRPATGDADMVPQATAAQDAAPADEPGPEPVAAPVTTITARFSYREESWTEVVDATGERLYFDLARAGSVVVVTGEPPLAVFLGNSPAVDIEVDGRRFDQSRYNRAGNVARFRLGTDR